ncbi:MAG: HxsD-like protein [Nannocystaceae bacterium]|nr:HxsD-like protein [Nannocystaceae bacterium]
MRLQFHRALYAGSAIDQALQRFAALAHFDRSENATHFVVELRGLVDADGDATRRERRARRIGHALANLALGLTIERGGPDR